EIGELAGSEVGKGTMPDELINAVEDLTDEQVKAAYVEHDKIGKLSDELKTWFDNGALVIPNFAKPVLFPGSETAHYSLCVGVEGDELIIVDPSADTVSGGVYYADDSEMLQAMDEFEGRKRGYVVMAPKETTAYWRIKNDLIYSDSSVYDELSKYCVQEVLRDLEIRNNVFGIGAAGLDVVGAYGLENVLEDIGYELDFVSGPITDTEVGKDTIEDYVGVPALNSFHEGDMEEAAEIVSENLS
ncbi:hypothetical protein HRED_04118, partial [Candidatus Haloredivivus sp. G17]